MSLTIDGGLFIYDFIDHHAILCVSVDAEFKEIRNRYLKIARTLHPDSCLKMNESDKEMANQLLAKLVNPAYEKFSVERNRAEYLFILSQMGKRFAQEPGAIRLKTESGRQLLAAPNASMAYKQAIAKISQTQFSDLPQSLKIIAEISELNLVYLMRMAGASMNKSAPSQPQQSSAPNLPPTPTSPPKEESIVEQYLRRAQVLLEKNQLSPAKVELQDALKLEPRNSHCHSLIAMVYLRQNQLKMAKVHFDNALKLNPNEKIALEWKPKVDQALGITTSGSQGTSASKTEEKQPDKSGKSGLFGGMFGGKKK
ncbi:J domain-containing protein [Dolichospermum sp. UHCC 0259]|uniref:J domain-containing protein n=1 Tax=Dolichospermum sp. UHCC 0259 TaxID=2590010 RepID=UPI00144896E4|nr:J domain-containing protein [Dolichospermum sp. UHCC 0259]MTJ49592.1 J domain-containing protein [Dolichospermum sp. UHCC 0259]